MIYRPQFEHPKHGRLMNLTSSANYLSISRAKFRRIAPPPELVQDGIYPFWSKRVLDILPTTEDFDYAKVITQGHACGAYLLGELDSFEVQELRRGLTSILHGFDLEKRVTHEAAELLLNRWGVPYRLVSNHHAKVYCENILHAFNRAEGHSLDLRGS